MLELLDIFIYFVIAFIVSCMLAYIFQCLVPSEENIEILMYEEIMLRQPRKNKYEKR